MKSMLLATVAICSLPVQLAWAAPQPAVPGQSQAKPTPVAISATAPETSSPTTEPASSSSPPPSVPAGTDPVQAAAPEGSAPAPVAPVAAVSSASVEPSPYGPPATAKSQPASPPGRSTNAEVPATLWDSNVDYAFGGMGGIGVMYTRIAGKDSPLICGEGAVIIDHALTLGGGGCGVTRLLKAQDYSSVAYDDNDRLTFGYGGAIGRYHFRSRKLVNVSVGALVGAGAVTTGSWTPKNGDNWEDKFDAQRHDAVFVFEPQVGAHMNITRWLRLGAVAGYRIVSGVDTKGLSAGDLSGLTLGGQVQAGWF